MVMNAATVVSDECCRSHFLKEKKQFFDRSIVEEEMRVTA